MHFRKYAGKNFGPFEAFDFDLVRGSIGVYGRNGRGKSTLLNGMYALLTNDFRRFPGIKADRVRLGTGEKDKSYIYGEVVHGPHVLKITRGFRSPAKSSLVIDDGAAITNDTKIAEEVRRILGVDQRMLDLYAFKEHNQLYDFLLNTPGERAKAFAVLCRTEGCNKIWDALGEFLNKDADVNAVIIDNSDEIAQLVVEAETRRDELNEQRTAEEALLLSEVSLPKAKEIVRKAERLQELLDDELPEARAAVSASAKSLAKQENVVAAAEASLKAAKDNLTKTQPKVDAARSALHAFKQYIAFRKHRRELWAERLALRKDRKAHPAPKKPKGYTPQKLEALRNEHRDAGNAVTAARKIVSDFEKTSGDYVCPTCKSVLKRKSTVSETLVAEKRRFIAETEPTVETLAGTIFTWVAYKKARETYMAWRTSHVQAVAANSKAIKSKWTTTVPKGDRKALKVLVAQHEKYETEVASTNARLNAAKTTAAACEATLLSDRKRVVRVEAEVEANTLPAETVSKARKRLDEHTAAMTNIARIDGELVGVLTSIKTRNRELAALRSRLQRSNKVRRLSRVLETVRELFAAQGGLQSDVAQTNLIAMEADINEGLKLFGEPFWVEADEGLSFKVHCPGKDPHPAEWLSTGQRVVLAMAFWPAVASLWSSDLGMLGLDEPTANLDADNRRFLSEAITQMTAKVRGNRQVVMLTHDPDLRSAFDQVIEV